MGLDKVRYCRKFEKMIPDFLHGKLSDDDFIEFYRHVKYCDSCREELTIQYLVKVGLDDTDTMNNLDFVKNLDRELDSKFNHIVKKRSMRFGLILVAVGIVLLAALSFIL